MCFYSTKIVLLENKTEMGKDGKRMKTATVLETGAKEHHVFMCQWLWGDMEGQKRSCATHGEDITILEGLLVHHMKFLNKQASLGKMKGGSPHFVVHIGTKKEKLNMYNLPSIHWLCSGTQCTTRR